MNPFLFIICFLICSPVFCQQQEFAVADTSSRPAITSVGNPDGARTEMKIGKDGGSLNSSDGKLTLNVPANTVSKNTPFSIQPLTNLMPNGKGPAYRLLPSGVKFNGPLELVFHYSDEDARDSMTLLMGIAMQDDRGRWMGLSDVTLDTTARTLTGKINHFSDWTRFDALSLTPGSTRLRVGNSLLLEIQGIRPDLSGPDDEVVSLMVTTPSRTVWRVNRIDGGNNSVGVLNTRTGVSSNNLYTAPFEVPDQNPVAVSVELKNLSGYFNKVRVNKFMLVSNILIYFQAYEIKMVGSIQGAAGSELGSVYFTDTGSCVISVEGKKSRLIEKSNRNMDDVYGYKGNCNVRVMQAGSGLFHITGTRSIRIIPSAVAQGDPEVEVIFNPTPMRISALQYSCPNKRGGPSTGNTIAGTAMMSRAQALPQMVRFTAKPGEQVILTQGTPGGEFYTKITVTKLPDD